MTCERTINTQHTLLWDLLVATYCDPAIEMDTIGQAAGFLKETYWGKLLTFS
jgi:hypothetical protein